MAKDGGTCTTCYGSGELVTEQGAIACPDCFGAGQSLGRGASVEWRLRELDKLYAGDGREANADVQWLVHELRAAREALVRILTLCDDAEDSDTLAREIKYQANEALRIYAPEID